MISTATAAIVLVATALAAAGALVWWRSALRGTTLMSVWWWSAVSLSAIAGVEAMGQWYVGATTTWLDSARYAAAMTTFCPPMALLGAKRPQDKAWQWIVLSLWLVLCLPSAQRTLFAQGDELHPAWFWFLVVLVFTGACNGLVTRRWPSSVLFGAAQIVLVAMHLGPAARFELPLPGPLLALAFLALAWWLTALEWPRRTMAVLPFDRVWLDFRDAYGAVWAIRVAQRMTESAARLDWPVELVWQGFVARDTGAPAGEVPAAAEESFRTVLRRFVSPEWIDRRLRDTPRT